MRMIRTWIGAPLGCLIIFLTAMSVQAQETHALIVGVTEYPEHVLQGAQKPLIGPRNDVKLLYATLTDLGVDASNIYVLADSLDKAQLQENVIPDGMPTRNNILQALNDLTERSNSGDRVIIYFSGHGSYIPVDPSSGSAWEEPDLCDEIFLPIDIGVWDSVGRVVDNQIVDDEIGAVVRSLVAADRFVWLIIDACHSGTGSRGPGSEDDDGASRRVSPTNALGVSADSFVAPSALTRGGGQAGRRRRRERFVTQAESNAGGFVGFYAALPYQSAWERSLPRSGADRRRHGLLTWHLVRAMRSAQITTYADLARHVFAGYWEWGSSSSERSTQPMFEGDLLQAAVRGRAERRFRFEERGGQLYLKAGELDNLGEGTVIGINQVSGGSDVIAYARVSSVGADEAVITIIEDDPSRPSLLLDYVTRDGMSDIGRWLLDRSVTLEARIVDRVIPFTLKLNVPPIGSAATQADKILRVRVQAWLGDLVSTVSSGQSAAVEETSDPLDADVFLVARDNRIWFSDEPADFPVDTQYRPYSLAREDLSTEKFGEALRQIARALNLARVASSIATTPIGSSLRSRVSIESRPMLQDGSCRKHTGDEVAEVPAGAVSVADLGFVEVDMITISHCDAIYIEVINQGSSSIDVTPLFIDPHSSIFRIKSYRGAALGGLQIQAGEARVLSFTISTKTNGLNVEPVGLARLILLAVKSDPSKVYATDFRHLTGRVPFSARRDGGTSSAVRRLLDDAAFGDGTARAGSAGDEMEQIGAVTITFDLLPPENQ